MAIPYWTAKFNSANINFLFGAEPPNLIPANSSYTVGTFLENYRWKGNMLSASV